MTDTDTTTSATPSFLGNIDPSKVKKPENTDKLDAIRKKVVELRDLELRKETVEETLKIINVSIYDLQHTILPEMFIEAQVEAITLPATGNMPGEMFTMSDYFKASISAEWEPERREAAFNYLSRKGHGDIIKTAVTIYFPKEQFVKARRLAQGQQKLGRQVEMRRDVPWSTLTSWLKEQVTKYGFIPDLEKIGGTIGKVVKIKTVRKSRSAPQ